MAVESARARSPSTNTGVVLNGTSRRTSSSHAGFSRASRSSHSGKMLKTGIVILALFSLVPVPLAKASLFGEENIPLMKLVLGQIIELEKLASAVEIAKEQQELLQQINAGVSRTIAQIEAIEEILTRAQGLDPRNIRRVSELTRPC